MEWFNKKYLVALSYSCCDNILQPDVHKGRDMKLPLSFHATFRMKESYDFKAEMYLGAALRGSSAQEATTQDIQHGYRRDFIKFPFHESDLPGDDRGLHHILDGVAKLVSPTVYADYVLARTFVSPTLERVEYVVNGPIKSAFQGSNCLKIKDINPLEIKEMPEYGGYQIPKLDVVFQRMYLLARMRTTLRARARTRRSSPSPNSPRERPRDYGITVIRGVRPCVKVKDANAP